MRWSFYALESTACFPGFLAYGKDSWWSFCVENQIIYCKLFTSLELIVMLLNVFQPHKMIQFKFNFVEWLVTNQEQ